MKNRELNEINELVKQAQNGDKESLNRLTDWSQKRLFEYVYRHTQRHDITDDIVQESMIKMFKVLGNLEKADRFWPWLRKIAFNKICDDYNQRKTVSIPHEEEKWGDSAIHDRPTGLANLISKELRVIIFAAMRQLKPRHREVLIMRCYENMEYDQIAQELDSSEFGVRMLFWRAKNSLQKQLARNKMGKGTLLTALIVFGKATAQTEAAAGQISVTAATLKTGVAVALIGTAGTKAGLLSLAAAGAITAGAVSIPTGPPATPAQLPTTLAVNSAFQSNIIPPAAQQDREYWYFYPDGPSGPVWTRLWQWDTDQKNRKCLWLQNAEYNGYFPKGSSTLSLVNYRLYNPDLSVKRLPCDPPALTNFLTRVEHKSSNFDYVRDTSRNLWVIVKQNGEESQTFTQRNYQYEIMQEEYFQPTRTTKSSYNDRRDTMHQRGWTYFTIQGQINNQSVQGKGRIPFTYAKLDQHYPWLKLRVGAVELTDVGGRKLFIGLARPWMGLHTIDTIRRDAAGRRIHFQTQYTPGKRYARVILNHAQGRLAYTIDMEKDVIDKITFFTDDSNEATGELNFSYLQELKEETHQFIQPRKSRYDSFEDGMSWLYELAKIK